MDDDEAPKLLDPSGGPPQDFDPDFLGIGGYTGWEGVTTDFDPWRDDGPPPDDWEKPEDWPDDWMEHIAEWREEGIAAGTWGGG